MKNLTFASVCLAIAIFGMLGCKKALIEPTKHKEIASNEYNLKSDLETNISTDGRLLIFNSLESYENLWTPDEENPSQSEAAVAQFIEDLSTLNYLKFKTSNNFIEIENAGMVEEFPSLIFELLNKDGAIQVGTHVFYFDFNNREGYAIKVADKESAYVDLISGNTSNAKVQKYDWEDEMIIWANEPSAKKGCNEKAASTGDATKSYTDKIEWDFLLNGNVFQNTVNASIQHKKFDGELKAKYRWTPGGWDLYAKVVLREKSQKLTGNINGSIIWTSTWQTANIPVKLEWQRRYKLKCKNDTGYQPQNNFGNGIATGQSWHGVRACSKYIVGANAYAQINGNWVLIMFGIPDRNVNGTLYQVAINSGY